MATETTFFKSVRRSNVVEDIIENFKQALISGEFKPGQRLPSEPELGERLGVGRSTIREAIKILAALGAVEVRRGDGTYISEKVTPSIIDPLLFAILVESNDATDLYEFRLMIEVGYNKLAAIKGDEEDFARIEAAIQEMREYSENGGDDVEVLANLDLKFHRTILEATKNPLTIKVGNMLNMMFLESLKQANSTPAEVQSTLIRHQSMLDVLRSKDPNKVEAATIDNLSGWKQSMEQ
ncbi:MAG: FadR/GntR family transcriptional regulator [Chloroflexota bacterium]